MQFTYVKRVGELILKVNGCQFGRLFDCEVCWLYEGTYQDEINSLLAGDMSPGEMLPIIKRAYIGLNEQDASEARAEAASERAFYAQLETNEEHRLEMERDDMMGRT